MLEQKVKERGIVFTAWSIPKVLDGTKTQTRRTWGLERINRDPDAWVCLGPYVDRYGYGDKWRFRRHGIDEEVIVKCPYGKVGDRPWVKEVWRLEMHSGCFDVAYKNTVWKKDAGSNPYMGKYAHLRDKTWRWRSPRFMPRWASRKDLEITELGAERLQEISWRDCKREGAVTEKMPFSVFEEPWKDAFERLWNSINATPKPVFAGGKIDHYVSYPWEDVAALETYRGRPWHIIGNPFVWPIGFRMI